MVDEKQLAEIYVKACSACVCLESCSTCPFVQIYLEFIFVYGVREYSNFIVLFIV